MTEYAATGTLLQSGDGGSPELYATIAKVTDFSGPRIDHPTIDVTGLEDTAKAYIMSGQPDMGDVTFSVVLDVDETGIHDTLIDRVTGTAASNYAICWPNIRTNEQTFSADAGTYQLTATDHGLHTGQPVEVYNDSGALPGGLYASTTYYVYKVDANTLELATTNANAVAGTTINITDNGSGTNSIYYGNKVTFSAFMTGAKPDGSVDDAVTGDFSMQITGAVTLA